MHGGPCKYGYWHYRLPSFPCLFCWYAKTPLNCKFFSLYEFPPVSNGKKDRIDLKPRPKKDREGLNHILLWDRKDRFIVVPLTDSLSIHIDRTWGKLNRRIINLPGFAILTTIPPRTLDITAMYTRRKNESATFLSRIIPVTLQTPGLT